MRDIPGSLRTHRMFVSFAKQRVPVILAEPGCPDHRMSPKDDLHDKWELEETWIVVSADGMRALGFERSNARPGEKTVGAMVVFQGVEAREVSADERRALQQARKHQKALDKQRRAQRQAERRAAKDAEKAAQRVEQATQQTT